MPDTITAVDENKFVNSVDLCAALKFFSKNRNNFTLDKSPKHAEQCEAVKTIINAIN
jgi:hypothetical protein